MKRARSDDGEGQTPKRATHTETVVISDSDDSDSEQVEVAPAPPILNLGPSAERYQLEQERLARQRAKQGAAAAAPTHAAHSAQDVYRNDASTSSRPVESQKRHLLSTSEAMPDHSSIDRGRLFDVAPIHRISPETRYFHGAVRQTRSMVQRRGGISMSEILGPLDNLESMFLSSFQIDPFWLGGYIEKCANGHAKASVLIHAPYESKHILQNSGANSHPSFTTEYAWMPKWSTFHPKFMILLYKDFCRIVVSSANLLPQDFWLLDNAFFIHDFPLAETHTFSYHASPITAPLMDIITHYSSFDTKALVKYDFTKSRANVSVISSIPANGAKGLPGSSGALSLRAILDKSGVLDNDAHLSFIESQCSSIGSFKSFIASFLQCIDPHCPEPEKILRIIHPSEEDVNLSALGSDGAGVFFCRPSSRELPHSWFRYTGKTSGLLSHRKTLFGVYERPSRDRRSAFYYLGSHNLSSAAWGRNKKLSPSNCEAGVVFAYPNLTRQDAIDIRSALSYRESLVPYAQSDRPYNAGGL